MAASKRSRRTERDRNLLDPAARHDQVTRVEHRSLSGSNGPLWLIEVRFDASVLQRIDCRRCRRVAIPNPDMCSRGFAQPCPGHPVDLACGEGGPQKTLT